MIKPIEECEPITDLAKNEILTEMEKIMKAAVSTGSLYDFMAAFCFFVDSLEDEQKKELCRMFASDPNLYSKGVTAILPFLEPEAGNVLYYSLTTGQRSELQNFWHCALKEKDYALLLGALYLMDRGLSHKENLDIFFTGRAASLVDDPDNARSEQYISFKSLNETTADSCGLLLPRLFCMWEKRNSNCNARSVSDAALNPLSACLSNYYWVPKQQWDVTNFYADWSETGLEKSQLTAESFVIVASPLDRHAPFTVDFVKAKPNRFEIHQFERYNDLIIPRFQATIDYAFRTSASIVVFPELMGTEECILKGEQYIAGQDASRNTPSLFLMPTIEAEHNGEWANTLRILDRNGDCIFHYHKQHPFRFDKKGYDMMHSEIEHYYEPIHEDKRVCIFHVPGIGRIGVMICSDIFYEGYLEFLLRDLKLTLLLYPVFSSGRDLMERKLSMASTYSCDVVLCNTTAALDNMERSTDRKKQNGSAQEDFVCVYYPYGHKENARISGKVDCCLYDGQCTGCLFSICIASNYYCNTVNEGIKQIKLEV